MLVTQAKALVVILSEVSNANEAKNLGQLRASEAGTGFLVREASFFDRQVFPGILRAAATRENDKLDKFKKIYTLRV